MAPPPPADVGPLGRGCQSFRLSPAANWAERRCAVYRSRCVRYLCSRSLSAEP